MMSKIQVTGFKPATSERFKAMIVLRDACRTVGLKAPAGSPPCDGQYYPPEVHDFFNGDPDHVPEGGVEVLLGHEDGGRDPGGMLVQGVERLLDVGARGFEVHLDEIDPDVRVLRFWAREGS